MTGPFGTNGPNLCLRSGTSEYRDLLVQSSHLFFRGQCWRDAINFLNGKPCFKGSRPELRSGAAFPVRIGAFVRSIRRIPKAVHELALAIAIGLFALFIFSLIKGHTFLGDQELGLQDRSYVSQADTGASDVVPPFLLLNLSQKDHLKLGYPAVAPRGLLAKLLTMAAAGDPHLIVLDADLGWSGDAAGEEELKAALKAIAARKKPVLLLVRSPFGRDDGPPIDASPASEPDVLRGTPYDGVVSTAPNLFWVSALAPIDGDGLTRRYRVATRVCRDRQSLTLPSVQLAACVALSDRGRLPALHAAAAPGPACTEEGAPVKLSVLSMFRCAGHDWPIGREGAEADIAYRMSWELPSGVSRPQQIAKGSDIPVEEVEIADALDLVEHADMIDVKAQFAGRVVIIGSSADVVGDRQRTALGPMPGMLVIANAIRSGAEQGPSIQSSLLLNLIATIVISAISYLAWAAVQRLTGIRGFIFRQTAAPALGLFWMILFTVVLPTGHVVEFLFPQFAVTLYLVVLEALVELHLQRSQSAPTPTAPSGVTP